jgi:hypothetical protein
MSYVEVKGRLRVPGKPWLPGTIRAIVRWDSDNGWSGFEPCISDIVRRQAEGPVLLTATGPAIPADSPRAAIVLACDCYAWEGIDSLDTDIPMPPLPPLPPGAVSGPRTAAGL